MADRADIADEIIQNRIEGHLAAHRLPTAIRGAMDIDCEDCGCEIPAPRRAAAPWATTCIECQSIREEKRRHVR